MKKTCIYVMAMLGTLSISAQAETISYNCVGNQVLRIEYSADGKTAAGLNDLERIAFIGRTAVARQSETGVSFISEDTKFGQPITIVGTSKSRVTITQGRRTFECTATK